MEKPCNRCREVKPADAEHFAKNKRNKSGLDGWCLECKRGYVREWQRNNKEKHRAVCRRWDANNKEKVLAFRRSAYEKNKHRQHSRQNERRRTLRREVLGHYSNGKFECACCHVNDYRFLTLDHINNDGGEHRRSLKGVSILAWAKREGFPPMFQVLCFNCNCGKGVYGVCPHLITDGDNLQ